MSLVVIHCRLYESAYTACPAVRSKMEDTLCRDENDMIIEDENNLLSLGVIIK